MGMSKVFFVDQIPLTVSGGEISTVTFIADNTVEIYRTHPTPELVVSTVQASKSFLESMNSIFAKVGKFLIRNFSHYSLFGSAKMWQ